MDSQNNHYRYLDVELFASSEVVAEAVERLSKQANALANTTPARSQDIRERLRQINQDLLTGDERRGAYDNSLLDALHAGEASRGGDGPLVTNREAGSPPTSLGGTERYQDVSTPYGMVPTPAPAPRSRNGAKYLVGGVILLVALGSAGGAFALAKGPLAPQPTATPTATSTPVPTDSPTPAVTSTATAQPTATHQIDSQVLVDTVDAYNAARKLRWGPTYDPSEVDSTTTGIARDAVLCLVDNNGKNLQKIGAYLQIMDESHGPQTIALEGSDIATLREHKSDLQLEYFADGTIAQTQESFTVTYTVQSGLSGWRVSDYAWAADNGATGSAAGDAARCQ